MTDVGPRKMDGLSAFSEQLRSGKISSAEATQFYLDRIEKLDPFVSAYETVTGESALGSAAAIDGLLKSGTDLGPLMGVPLAIKDIIAVSGAHTTAGSNIDVSDLIGPEGAFVKRLRRAGCVFLGKTKTIEFALGGAGGVNTIRGTPRNPWDSETHRGPGGSSSGSAAAVAAGMASFAIGTDTGGSVRIPAALCGVFGFKPSHGLWPLDGVFPLCPTLDTIGLITRSAEDAAVIFGALNDERIDLLPSLEGVRLGLPVSQFEEPLDRDVEEVFECALGVLRRAGAVLEPVEVPHVGRPEDFFHSIVPSEFLSAFGRDRFERERGDMGADISARGEAGIGITADSYINWKRRHDELRRLAAERFRGFDAWITPTVSMTAPPVSAFDDVSEALPLNARIGYFTRPANLYGFCTSTTPLPVKTGDLPVGLQLMAPSGADAALLSLAVAVENILGLPVLPALSAPGGQQGKNDRK